MSQVGTKAANLERLCHKRSGLGKSAPSVKQVLDSKKQVFDLVEVSEHTGLSVYQLRDMVATGRLEAIQPGGCRAKLFVQRAELERMLTPIEVPK